MPEGRQPSWTEEDWNVGEMWFNCHHGPPWLPLWPGKRKREHSRQGKCLLNLQISLFPLLFVKTNPYLCPLLTQILTLSHDQLQKGKKIWWLQNDIERTEDKHPECLPISQEAAATGGGGGRSRRLLYPGSLRAGASLLEGQSSVHPRQRGLAPALHR